MSESPDKIYRVHVFAVVRVPVEVLARSQREAIGEAHKMLDLYRLFDDKPRDGCEWAEEVSHYLVDEVGDEEYDASRWWHRENGELTEGAYPSYHPANPNPTATLSALFPEEPDEPEPAPPETKKQRRIRRLKGAASALADVLVTAGVPSSAGTKPAGRIAGAVLRALAKRRS